MFISHRDTYWKLYLMLSGYRCCVTYTMYHQIVIATKKNTRAFLPIFYSDLCNFLIEEDRMPQSNIYTKCLSYGAWEKHKHWAVSLVWIYDLVSFECMVYDWISEKGLTWSLISHPQLNSVKFKSAPIVCGEVGLSYQCSWLSFQSICCTEHPNDISYIQV